MKKYLFSSFLVIALSSKLFSQINTFPDITDFESESTCGTSCSGSCNPVGNWKNADQFGFPQAGTDWLVNAGSTPSTATGPDIDHTLGTATGKYIYVETSGCNLITAHLVSNIYDFTALSSPKIKFWYHMYGATMGTMHLDVDTTGLGDWVLDVTPAWTDNVNTWQLKNISIAAVAAGRPSVRIRIRAITGTSFTSDMGVDDIEVYQPVANDIDLFKVSAGGGCGNSATTPVIIKMINVGSDTIPVGTSVPVSFDINSVVVTDNMVTTLSIPPTDTFTYTFTSGFADLSGPSTVFVTAWSAWVADLQHGNDTATVTTIGIPVITNYPYVQDFESGQNGWIINNGSLGTWAFGTPAKTTINSASSGVNAFVTGGLGTGFYNDLDNSYVEGPCFDFTNVCDPVISLRVWWNAEFSWDGMNVTYSTDGGTTWNLAGNFGDPFNWYSDNTVVGNPGGYQSAWSGRNSTTNGSGGWLTARHRLTGAGNMANVKIRINFGSDGSVTDDGVAFDDIKIFNGADLGMDRTVCSPSTLTLDADNGTPTPSYLWNSGETTSSLTTSTTGWHAVTVTNGSCVVTDSMYLVVVDALSDVALGPDVTTCSTTSTLDAGYWPESNYLWSDGETTQTINASTSGNYGVSVTTSCGVLQDTILLTLNPSPVVNLGNDSTFCGSATLTAGNGTDTYLWNTSETTAVVHEAGSSTYSVMVTNSFGCSNSDTISVSVNPLPSVSIGGNTSICGAGNSTNLVANGALTYLWSSGQSAAFINVTPNADSTFIVTGTDVNGCTNMDTTLVYVHPLPVVMLGNDSAQCAGTITLDAGAGYVSYLWNNGDITQTTTTPADGNYYVSVTDTNNCTANSDTVALTFYHLPYIDLGADVSQCGGSVVLDAGAQSAYFWNNGDLTQTTTVSASGTYYVTVTDVNGCTSSDTVLVTINTPPTAGLTLPFSTVCVTDAAYALSGGTPAGGVYGGPGVIGSNFNPSVAGTGTWTLLYTYTDVNGCSDLAQQNVIVNSCVGIHENFTDANLTVYPNPSAGIFTLDLNGLTKENVSLTVVDASGRKVMEENMNTSGTALHTELNLSNLENGIYFLVLKSGDENKMVKLVLNK